jgi:hypothetical protein
MDKIIVRKLIQKIVISATSLVVVPVVVHVIKKQTDKKIGKKTYEEQLLDALVKIDAQKIAENPKRKEALIEKYDMIGLQ